MFSSAVWLGVSTDYELLFQMEFDLNPCAAAVSDFGSRWSCRLTPQGRDPWPFLEGRRCPLIDMARECSCDTLPGQDQIEIQDGNVGRP
jgi:hypothetical protein